MHGNHFYSEVEIIEDKLDIHFKSDEELLAIDNKLEALTRAVLLLAQVIQFKKMGDK